MIKQNPFFEVEQELEEDISKDDRISRLEDQVLFLYQQLGYTQETGRETEIDENARPYVDEKGRHRSASGGIKFLQD